MRRNIFITAMLTLAFLAGSFVQPHVPTQLRAVQAQEQQGEQQQGSGLDTSVPPGLKVKAAANYEFNGIALNNAVGRVTFLAFSALDKSARVEVAIWPTLAAYQAGKRPIETKSVSITGTQYNQVLAANAQLWGAMVLGAEGLVLADSTLGQLFESNR